MVFIQISYFDCYEYSRIFRENIALFTLKKKSLKRNLYLWKSEKKIVVTSTRVILRKTDFFRFSPKEFLGPERKKCVGFNLFDGIYHSMYERKTKVKCTCCNLCLAGSHL